MRRALVAACLAVQSGMVSAQAASAPSAVASLAEQRVQVRAQQAALRERLAALQASIAAQDVERQTALQALQAADAAMDGLLRELDDLAQQARAIQGDIDGLTTELAHATVLLDARRQTLADMLRAHYMGGLSPWTALLAGADARTIALELGYFRYLAEAQSAALDQVQAALAAREHAYAERLARQHALEVVQVETQGRADALQNAQRAQAQQLRQLDQELHARRAQADQILAEVRGLDNLLTRLEADAARQRQAASSRELSAGGQGLQALQGKLPHPVVGEITGRFGAERPEGGRWRGVVIRADAGSAVRAVAAGRVVYAQWLTGFGHLMIVDHGAQFLSVYAYNQSLVRAVGDTVDAGSTLAWVGSTGGQVEPGLYFELRVAGIPVNPRLWLQP